MRSPTHNQDEVILVHGASGSRSVMGSGQYLEMGKLVTMPTKPLPPNTAAKLNEAFHYLVDMESASESTDQFRQHVADFLTAARSVKDVLIIADDLHERGVGVRILTGI